MLKRKIQNVCKKTAMIFGQILKKICRVHQNEPTLARYYRRQEQDGNFVTNVVNTTEKSVENAIFSCKM